MTVNDLKKELNFTRRTKIIDFQENKVLSVARDFSVSKKQVHDNDIVVFYRFIPFYNIYGQLLTSCGDLEVFVIQPYFDRNKWRWVNCE